MSMERTYFIEAQSPLGERIPHIAVTVVSDFYQYGTDADGNRGEMIEEIREILVEAERPLPTWAEADAQQRARVLWMEGR